MYFKLLFGDSENLIGLGTCTLYNFGSLRQQEYMFEILNKKVQVGKDQEKAQSEKDSHSKNRGGKKPN